MGDEGQEGACDYVETTSARSLQDKHKVVQCTNDGRKTQLQSEKGSETLQLASLYFLVLIGSLSWPGLATAENYFDPSTYCETHLCSSGPSLFDPPILNEEWEPFPSNNPVVWGADVCLGYFLTKHPTAWNGGVRSETDPAWLYLTLEGDRARVRMMDWPIDSEGSPYSGYGTFTCQNTKWPEHRLDEMGIAEIRRWARERLSAANGWTGNIENWGAVENAEFRNDVLSLMVIIRNWSGSAQIKFEADYLGPPILYQ